MELGGTDQQVLEKALQWLNENHSVVLVTVVDTWGSSPRPKGSLLAMRTDGIHTGSVSGGCVEEDLLTRYQQGELAERLPTMISYGINRNDAMRFGLPCGGRLEVLVEQLTAAKPLEVLLQKIQAGELITRRVCLNTGEVSYHPALPGEAFSYNQNYLNKQFGPQWQMLLIGAGHLSQYVTQLAKILDYQVTVCDPRQEYRLGWETQGVNLTCLMPDDAVKALQNQNRGIVIALTHDPKLDDMALVEALTTDLFYVGAIGSQRSNNQRRQRLAQLGLSAPQIAKLHAPVGLPIGSHAPSEIAISIMAEIIAKRNSALTETSIV